MCKLQCLLIHITQPSCYFLNILAINWYYLKLEVKRTQRTTSDNF